MPRRNKPYITQYFERDRTAFTALFCTGHVKQEHLRCCGLADSRIKNLIRDGHLEKVFYKQACKIKKCYKLTKYGRVLAYRLWGLDKQYHAQNPSHDTAIADKYFSIPLNSRNQWVTETQIRDKFLELLNKMRDEGENKRATIYEEMLNKGLISMPDAVYIDENGTEVAFEVVTNTYGREELKAKETLVKLMDYEYEIFKI